MEPVAPEWLEAWKWAGGIAISAISGAVTAAITISRVIFKLDKNVEDVLLIKRVLFKETGGMNVMTEMRHIEVCANTMRFFEQDFDHIKERIDAIEEKLDIVLNTANQSGRHAEELKELRGIMAEINEKLGRAWKMDRDSQVGHS